MSPSWKILIIVESEDDFLTAKAMLKEAKGQVDDVQWAASYEAGREALHSDQYQAILINDNLGVYSGIDLIREANERGCSAPLILYTNQRSFGMEIEAMQAGAILSITKDEITPLLLERAIRYAIEKKQNETSLRMNEAHLRERNDQFAYQAVILQNIYDAVIATDPDRIITFWNHGAVQLYGWTAEEALGRPVGELIPSEMTEEQRQAAVQELSEKGNFTGSMVQYGRDGRKMWVEGRVIALSDDSGKITSFVTANREMTELKQVQNELITQREALRESEEKYRTFFENLRENVLLFEIVRDDQDQLIDLIVRDANPPALASIGLDREMIVGRRAGELFPSEALERMLVHLPNMLKTGEPWTDEQVYQNRHFHYAVFRMAHNMIAVSSQDITERREAEQALNESRERLERAQQIAHLGSWELDLIHNQLTWSDEVYHIFGLHPQEFGATYEAFLDHIHPDDRMAVDAAYSSSLKENRDSYEIEHRVVRKSTGEIRFVHEKCEHFRDSAGRLIRSVGMIQDITERKQAEQALEASEAKYRTLFESSPDAIFLTKPDGSVEAANPAACAMLGRTEQELCALGRSGILDTNDPRLRAVLDERNRTGVIKAKELTAIRKNEERFPVETSSVILPSEPTQSFVIMRDITEQKQAENALRQSETKFSTLFNQAAIPTMLCRLHDQVYIDVNEAWVNLFGYARDEVVGKSARETGINLNAGLRDRLVGEIQHQPITDVEFPVVTKSGKGLTVLTNINQIELDGQNYVLISAQDITKRKQAEAAVQEEQAKLEAVVENLGIGVMIGEADGSQISMNSAALRLFDLPPNNHVVSHPVQFLQSYEIRFLDGRLTPPEARPAIRAMRGDYFSNLELQVRNLRTGQQWIGSWSATPIRNQQREMQLLVITVQDITERKQAEQSLRESEGALRQSEARLRDFLESTHDSFFSLDRNWRVQYINRRFTEILGIRAEDVLGAVFWEKFPGYIGTPVEQNYRKVMEERIPIHFTAGGVYSNAWYEVSIYPAGEGITVFASDRTEEHRALNALQESEQKYRSLFENSAEAIFLTNTDGSVQAANPAACAIFGWTEEEIMRLGRAGLLDTEDPRLAEALDIRKQTGRFQSREYTGIRKGGERFPVEADSVVLPGEPSRAFVILRDITERKRAEQALQASENRLRKLVEGNIIGVDVRDAAGHLKDANTTFLNLVGYTCDELQSSTLSIKDLTPPEFWPIDQQAVEEALVRGSCQPYEKAFIHKDGHIIPTMVGYTRIDENSDDFIGFVLDLSELKQAQATLQDYADKLKHSNAELEQFAFVASHDLQEPLRKIKLFGTAIQQKLKGKLDEDTQDNFQRMLNASERMQAMIRDLLELSRVNTQGRPFEQVDLNAIAADVISDLETLVMRTEGQVVVDPLPTIEADPIQIHQVLQNLIGNALKFHRRDVTPLVKVSGTTLISNGKKLELVSIQIQDNGIGFEEGLFEKILQPFQRLHGRSEYEGNGIGLAIVKKIIERHHGFIAAYSVPDEGSTFTITLPIHQSN